MGDPGPMKTTTNNGTITHDVYGMQYLFQGERYFATTNEYQMGARDFAVSLGRWAEEDPAGYVNGANLYLFVGGNTINRMDPQGLDTEQSANASPTAGGVVRAGVGVN